MADVKLSQLAATSPASVAAGAALWTLPGHIDGLRMEWLAANQLRVTSGSAYIQSLGYAINVAAAITKTGLTLTANTWYHVYLYMNGATPDIEIVTAAPAAPYSGSARAKTSDTSRRYLGSVRADAANTMLRFIHVGDKIAYNRVIGTAPTRVLSSGTATAPTAVPLNAVVPITSKYVELRCQDTDPAFPWFGNSDVGDMTPGNANDVLFLSLPTNASQEVTYHLNSAATSGGVFIDVAAYTLER